VSPRGLRLVSGNQDEVFVPLGTPVRYLGGNRLAVPLDDREIELAIGNLTIYRQRLARDVATFLSGDRALPWPADYHWPWYVYLLWLAPAGLPLLAAFLDAAGDDGEIAFLLCFLAIPLVFTAYALIQRDPWPRQLRLLLAAGLSVAAYTAAWAGTSAGGSSLNIHPLDWQHLHEPGEYTLRMPGNPVVQNRLRRAQLVQVFVVELKQRQAAFTFDFVDLPDSPHHPTHQQLKELFEEGVQALQRETPEITRVSEQPLALKNGTCPGREYLFTVSNRMVQGKMVARMYFDQGRLYTLTAAGKNVQPQSPDVRNFFDSLTIE
jgi:hypothetical protein